MIKKATGGSHIGSCENKSRGFANRGQCTSYLFSIRHIKLGQEDQLVAPCHNVTRERSCGYIRYKLIIIRGLDLSTFVNYTRDGSINFCKIGIQLELTISIRKDTGIV